MKIRSNIALAAAIALMFSGAVFGQEPSQTAPKTPPKGTVDCKKDVRRFCKKVKPGDGRVGKCLYDNLNKLSKACRAYALHGGPGHELESLSELDQLLANPKLK